MQSSRQTKLMRFILGIAADSALAATIASGDAQNSQIQINSTLVRAIAENIGYSL